MKSLKDKLFESKVDDLLSEVQNEEGDKAEYHTFSFDKGKKKFKKGFLSFNEADEIVVLNCFNSAKDLAELIGTDEDAYDEYDNIKVGECKIIDEGHPEKEHVLRIW